MQRYLAPYACLALISCTNYPADPAGGAGNAAGGSPSSSAGGGATTPAGGGNSGSSSGGTPSASGGATTAAGVPSPGNGVLGFTLPPDSAADEPLPACGREVAVSSQETLEAALLAAQPGDCIVLADGNYEAPGITVTGSAEAPIVIRSQNPLGAVFNDGQLEVSASSYLVFDGLTFATPDTMKVIDCQYTRFTRCKFALTVEDDWFVMFGNMSQHNRVDHCEFGPKQNTPGPFIVVGQEDTMSHDDRFDHNYFHDNGPPAVNEKESIRIGWSGVYTTVASEIVEYNLFENCDGDPEIVSIKTHQNIVRYNTVRTSAGVLSLRHGDGSYLYGNYILAGQKELDCTDRDNLPVKCAAGGIRVYGRDHKIFNNYIEGSVGTGHRAPIQIDGGDGSSSDAHHQVVGVQVVANTLVDNLSGIEIGKNYDSAPKDSVLAFNLVRAPAGMAIQNFKAGTTMKFIGNLLWADDGSSDVGLVLAAEQATVSDPLLEKLGEIWKIQSGSPAIDAASGLADMLVDDIEGQLRSAPDIGADELADGAALRGPLTATDVGIDAP